MAHVDSLIKAGIPPSAIGVITPYNAQVWKCVRHVMCVIQLARMIAHPNAHYVSSCVHHVCTSLAQVALLKEMRSERLSGVLEVSSVDGFQVWE